MAGFRNIVFKGISNFASSIPTSMLIKATKQPLILPFYHSISNMDAPHIKHLYKVKSEEEFVKDLDYLLQYYEPINLQSLIEVAVGEKRLKAPSFFLSFDDGLSEFHDIIAPILLKKGIPATCFLNSNFIDNKDLFYRYKASLLIELIEKHSKHLENKNLQEILQNKNFRSFLLSLKYKNKETINNIANVLDYDFNEYLAKEKPYLNTEQLQSLLNKGFTFGAHSADHPMYKEITLDQQLEQTSKSLAFINAKLDIKHQIFSFPFTDHGVKYEYFNQANKLLDLSFGSAGLKIETISNHLQRIPFEMNDLSAKQIINSEYLYYLLKSPFGKNINKR